MDSEKENLPKGRQYRKLCEKCFGYIVEPPANEIRREKWPRDLLRSGCRRNRVVKKFP